MSAPIKATPFQGRVGRYKDLTWPVIDGWEPERVAALERMWADGLSATQIAKTLGFVTRNGVIGKVHRMGLAARAAASDPGTPRRPPQRPAAPVSPPRPMPRTPPPAQAPTPVREPVLATPQAFRPGTWPAKRAFEPLPGSHPRPFFDRPARGCKWPIGEENLSCCEPFQGDGPYCQTHTMLAYAAPTRHRTANELVRSVRRYI